MAQIKVVFLMHDVDQFNGAVADRVYGVEQAGFQYPEGSNAISGGRTKQELCDNLRPGSDNAKHVLAQRYTQTQMRQSRLWVSMTWTCQTPAVTHGS